MTSTLSTPADIDPRLVHPDWCDLDHHQYAGKFDQIHSSRPVTLVLAEDLPADRAVITVRIEQRVSRCGVDPWKHNEAEVVMSVDSGDSGCVGLTCAEIAELSRVMTEHRRLIGDIC